MAELSDFYAKGVSFPELSHHDVNQLIERIPSDGTLHLAILQQPYLDLIVDGSKTIESRFNNKRAAPFGKVAVGDLVLLKETGRPIRNYFFAAAVRCFDLMDDPIATVRAQYGAGICVQNEEEFWYEKRDSRYCTLVKVGERGGVERLPIAKKDQRGWVTFLRTDRETLF